MADASYSLAWPRALFEWEAGRQLAAYAPTDDWCRSVTQLLREAFEDVDVGEAYERETGLSNHPWLPDDVYLSAHSWLKTLLSDDARLREYVAPVYWAERTGRRLVEPPGYGFTLAQDFLKLVDDLADHGYFPKILPALCRHDDDDVRAEAARTISQAIRQSVAWPIDPKDADELTESTLLSLVEFFNDQAQRPRLAWSHDSCTHYKDYNRESGGAVYRWQVNLVLERHKVPLRLGASGEERGRLVRNFGSPLDDLLTEQITRRLGIPEDEVSHAIREYRERGATVTQKRSALTKLASELEPRRDAMKEHLVRKDEGYLFDIANNYALRHRDAAQKRDIDEVFYDWMFWNYMAMIQLMDELEARPAGNSNKD